VTAFVVVAALLVAAALAWLLPPLLKPRSSVAADRARMNLEVVRDQLAEAQTDHQRGVLSAEQFGSTRAELERRVLEEAGGDVDASMPAANTSRRRLTAIVVAVIFPLAAGLLYWQLGNHIAFDPAAQRPAGQQFTAEDVERMVASLAQRLEKEPDNSEGWAMLARSYYLTKRFADSSRAYERLAQLQPDNAAVLADYADALAMASDRRISGKPIEIARRALKLEPRQPKALAMAAAEAFDRKDYPSAIGYWERLRAVLPPETELAKSIDVNIAEARTLGKSGPLQKKAAGSIMGTVRLGASLASKAASGETVFVFARAADNKGPPLAVIQLKVSELPAKFTLDDSRAMTPQRKLSDAKQVVVGARVSKSGRPTASKGDLEGLSKPMKPGARDVTIVIDRVVP